MSDTKRMEMIAENLIAHFLQRHNILVTKPYFDQDGGDLFAMTTEGGIRYCRIQCKGRTVRPGKPSSVVIDADLDMDSLVVCLFVDDGSFDKLNLYVFFSDDIQQWTRSSDATKFTLSLSCQTFAENLKSNRVTELAIQRIGNEIMKAKLPTTAIFKYTGSGGLTTGGEAEAKQL